MSALSFTYDNCSQEVCAWIRNNWRSHKTVHTAPLARKKNRLDIVWRERKDEVLKEVNRLHTQAGGEGEPSHGDKFKLRNTAARNVHAGMNEDEKAAIMKEVERSGEEANPPEIQRK